MTTSHRPTLESRKGRDLQATSIVHSRKVAAHRQLKYRKIGNDQEEGTLLDERDAKAKVDELKNELLERERAHYKQIKGDDYDYKDRQLTIEDKKVDNGTAESESESYQDKMKRVAQETENLDDSSDDEENDDHQDDSGANGDDDESVNESSSDEDDDSDEEAELLRELEKIKKERAEAQSQRDLKEKQESAINSNPLLNPNKPIKKNWRQDKIFNYKNNSEKRKTDDDYVNDLLRSDFHQKFLNKYVK